MLLQAGPGMGMVSVGGTCTLGVLAEGPPVGGRPARLSFWTSLLQPVSGLVFILLLRLHELLAFSDYDL